MPTPPASAPSTPSRRGFLGLATGALTGLIAFAAGVPVLGALLSPLLGERRAKGVRTFVRVARLSDLRPGVPFRAEIVQSITDAWARQDGIVLGAAWLVRQPGDAITAFSTVCPHLGCAINTAPGDTFACPCHDSAFGGDGQVRSGPSPRAMDRLEVEVKDGWVSLRPARFKQGLAKPEES